MKPKQQHIFALAILVAATASSLGAAVAVETSGHGNNWAVLVDTSRYWFNYRHIANTLSIYTTVKR